ncbi:hypothetical protein ACWDO0_16325 [Nocardia rhamnosiphila]
MAKPDIAQPGERQKQARALEMRIAGLPWAFIAEQLGYADHSGAFRAVEALLKRQESEKAEEYRKIEDERLDLAIRKLYPGVRAGDLKAIDMWLKAHDRRVKLHGLAMPDKVLLQQFNVGVTHEEFTARVQEDMRELGFDRVFVVPPEPDDPAEPWANT